MVIYARGGSGGTAAQAVGRAEERHSGNEPPPLALRLTISVFLRICQFGVCLFNHVCAIKTTNTRLVNNRGDNTSTCY